MRSFVTPKFTITARTLELVASVSEKIGAVNALFLNKIPEKTKSEYLINSVYSTLVLDDVIINKSFISKILSSNSADNSNNDDLEFIALQNTVAAYKNIGHWHPYSLSSLLSAHESLMEGISKTAGKIRTESVGLKLYRNKIQTAPDPGKLEYLLENLFSYVKTSRDLLLIRCCVFYYELMFIRPFDTGNGRMARLWFKVLLNEYNSVLGSISLESLMLAQKQAMHDVLSRCIRSGKSTLFIEFVLGIIDSALGNLLKEPAPVITVEDRIRAFQNNFVPEIFSRKDYMQFFKNISTATASRDLQFATENGIINKTGDKNQAVYRFRVK